MPTPASQLPAISGARAGRPLTAGPLSPVEKEEKRKSRSVIQRRNRMQDRPETAPEFGPKGRGGGLDLSSFDHTNGEWRHEFRVKSHKGLLQSDALSASSTLPALATKPPNDNTSGANDDEKTTLDVAHGGQASFPALTGSPSAKRGDNQSQREGSFGGGGCRASFLDDREEWEKALEGKDSGLDAARMAATPISAALDTSNEAWEQEIDWNSDADLQAKQASISATRAAAHQSEKNKAQIPKELDSAASTHRMSALLRTVHDDTTTQKASSRISALLLADDREEWEKAMDGDGSQSGFAEAKALAEAHAAVGGGGGHVKNIKALSAGLSGVGDAPVDPVSDIGGDAEVGLAAAKEAVAVAKAGVEKILTDSESSPEAQAAAISDLASKVATEAALIGPAVEQAALTRLSVFPSEEPAEDTTAEPAAEPAAKPADEDGNTTQKATSRISVSLLADDREEWEKAMDGDGSQSGFAEAKALAEAHAAVGGGGGHLKNIKALSAGLSGVGDAPVEPVSGAGDAEVDLAAAKEAVVVAKAEVEKILADSESSPEAQAAAISDLASKVATEAALVGPAVEQAALTRLSVFPSEEPAEAIAAELAAEPAIEPPAEPVAETDTTTQKASSRISVLLLADDREEWEKAMDGDGSQSGFAEAKALAEAHAAVGGGGGHVENKKALSAGLSGVGDQPAEPVADIGSDADVDLATAKEAVVAAKAEVEKILGDSESSPEAQAAAISDLASKVVTEAALIGPAVEQAALSRLSVFSSEEQVEVVATEPADEDGDTTQKASSRISVLLLADDREEWEKAMDGDGSQSWFTEAKALAEAHAAVGGGGGHVENKKALSAGLSGVGDESVEPVSGARGDADVDLSAAKEAVAVAKAEVEKVLGDFVSSPEAQAAAISDLASKVATEAALIGPAVEQAALTRLSVFPSEEPAEEIAAEPAVESAAESADVPAAETETTTQRATSRISVLLLADDREEWEKAMDGDGSQSGFTEAKALAEAHAAVGGGGGHVENKKALSAGLSGVGDAPVESIFGAGGDADVDLSAAKEAVVVAKAEVEKVLGDSESSPEAQAAAISDLASKVATEAALIGPAVEQAALTRLSVFPSEEPVEYIAAEPAAETDTTQKATNRISVLLLADDREEWEKAVDVGGSQSGFAEAKLLAEAHAAVGGGGGHVENKKALSAGLSGVGDQSAEPIVGAGGAADVDLAAAKEAVEVAKAEVDKVLTDSESSPEAQAAAISDLASKVATEAALVGPAVEQAALTRLSVFPSEEPAEEIAADPAAQDETTTQRATCRISVLLLSDDREEWEKAMDGDGSQSGFAEAKGLAEAHVAVGGGGGHLENKKALSAGLSGVGDESIESVAGVGGDAEVDLAVAKEAVAVAKAEVEKVLADSESSPEAQAAAISDLASKVATEAALIGPAVEQAALTRLSVLPSEELAEEIAAEPAAEDETTTQKASSRISVLLLADDREEWEKAMDGDGSQSGFAEAKALAEAHAAVGGGGGHVDNKKALSAGLSGVGDESAESITGVGGDAEVDLSAAKEAVAVAKAEVEKVLGDFESSPEARADSIADLASKVATEAALIGLAVEQAALTRLSVFPFEEPAGELAAELAAEAAIEPPAEPAAETDTTTQKASSRISVLLLADDREEWEKAMDGDGSQSGFTEAKALAEAHAAVGGGGGHVENKKALSAGLSGVGDQPAEPISDIGGDAELDLGAAKEAVTVAKAEVEKVLGDSKSSPEAQAAAISDLASKVATEAALITPSVEEAAITRLSIEPTEVDAIEPPAEPADETDTNTQRATSRISVLLLADDREEWEKAMDGDGSQSGFAEAKTLAEAHAAVGGGGGHAENKKALSAGLSGVGDQPAEPVSDIGGDAEVDFAVAKEVVAIAMAEFEKVLGDSESSPEAQAAAISDLAKVEQIKVAAEATLCGISRRNDEASSEAVLEQPVAVEASAPAASPISAPMTAVERREYAMKKREERFSMKAAEANNGRATKAPQVAKRSVEKVGVAEGGAVNMVELRASQRRAAREEAQRKEEASAVAAAAASPTVAAPSAGVTPTAAAAEPGGGGGALSRRQAAREEAKRQAAADQKAHAIAAAESATTSSLRDTKRRSAAIAAKKKATAGGVGSGGTGIGFSSVVEDVRGKKKPTTDELIEKFHTSGFYFTQAVQKVKKGYGQDTDAFGDPLGGGAPAEVRGAELRAISPPRPPPPNQDRMSRVAELRAKRQQQDRT